jgi:glycerol-3-phosphate dehydrogenase (NAD+)
LEMKDKPLSFTIVASLFRSYNNWFVLFYFWLFVCYSSTDSSITGPIFAVASSSSNSFNSDCDSSSGNSAGLCNNNINNIMIRDKVCIIGSGNWGSAIATIIGPNCERLDHVDTDVNLWVFEEMVEIDGGKRKLSEVINERHENVKYLPGVTLPRNIIAEPDLATACRNATLVIYVTPHQFLPPLLPTIRKSVHPTCRGVSLIKGLDFDKESKSPVLISQMIEEYMKNGFSCGVLTGANVANEVAARQVCESTLACTFDTDELNERTRQIFHTQEYFRVEHIADVVGAQVYGALKNVVALGAGFIDALELGGNTKAALLRIGLHEMSTFAHAFFPKNKNKNINVQFDTILQSCGVADLVTTCYGGRNRKCAQAFGVKKHNSQQESWNEKECHKVWNQLEKELLNGQKLQGTLASHEVYECLKARDLLESFPLFKTIHSISFSNLPVSQIVDGINKLDQTTKSLSSSDTQKLSPSAFLPSKL